MIRCSTSLRRLGSAMSRLLPSRCNISLTSCRIATWASLPLRLITWPALMIVSLMICLRPVKSGFLRFNPYTWRASCSVLVNCDTLPLVSLPIENGIFTGISCATRTAKSSVSGFKIVTYSYSLAPSSSGFGSSTCCGAAPGPTMAII